MRCPDGSFTTPPLSTVLLWVPARPPQALLSISSDSNRQPLSAVQT